MSSVARPRGRLPKRVYWTRRALVLGVLALLVFGVVHLFGGSGGNGPSTRNVAAPLGSRSSGPTPSASLTPTPSVTSASHIKGKHRTGKKSHDRPGSKKQHVQVPLAEPTGPCQSSDVVVNPSVHRAYAGRTVTIALDLTTRTSPACTWEVTPKTVVVELTSGNDRIWSTQDCPSVVGDHSVVVRKDHVTKVRLQWGGRRSDAQCSHSTLWAQPGWYHVKAAAFGAGPSDQQFHLLPPPRPTITKAPKPHKHGTGAAHASPGPSPSAPAHSPSASPPSASATAGG